MPPPRTRLAIIREAISWPWRLVLALWALIGFYDLALSQLVPEEFGKQAPKAWQVAVLTGNLLPWWGWTIGFLVIALAATIEYVFRRSHSGGVVIRSLHLTDPSPVQPHNVPRPSQPTVLSVAPRPDESRVFVGSSVTPGYLIQIMKDHTGFEAEKLLEPFIGKWMHFSGTVAQARPTKIYGYPKDEDAAELIFHADVMVALRFRAEWIDRITIIRRGENVSAIGKIISVNTIFVQLDECEMTER